MRPTPRQGLLALALLALAPTLPSCAPTIPRESAPATRNVFELVVPSVVAIVNDDAETKRAEAKATMLALGVDEHAPKRIVDVSLRKDPMPSGTGFVIEGGLVVTAAHVILAPEQLVVKTRSGASVPADLVHIDEVRDVAILRPRGRLAAPPLPLGNKDPDPGHRVWALGHTGAGLWALAWGISEGVASGTVDLLGSKLLLFDAPVYPGFSGGPVITLDDQGKPTVVGVNHAILFTGRTQIVASISSAASLGEIKDVLAKKPPVVEAELAAYAKKRATEPRAELFITKAFQVHKDASMLTTATIVGDERSIALKEDEPTRVPVVALLFGLPRGDHQVTFELLDPQDKVVASIPKTVTVSGRERVAFGSAEFRVDTKSGGHHEVVVKARGKTVGTSAVWLQDPDDDNQGVDPDHTDQEEDGEPTVDVVVAQKGSEEPFALGGIRAGWMEWRYPRRVEFAWFARGSRGWSGTNVSIQAFVLDQAGKIVGRGVGCMKPELRPEKAWTCTGSGGTPLLPEAGPYDIVFAINGRPIAVWPMEAMLRSGQDTNAYQRWLQDLRRQGSTHDHSKDHSHDHAPKKR